MSVVLPEASVLALDVGSKRIGVARAKLGTHFSVPCAVLNHNDKVFADITHLVNKESAVAIVVGLPRNLSGDDTPQTISIREFISQLKSVAGVPIYQQDEAGTSKKAEAELRQHKRPPKGPAGSVDALAATYILEDFLTKEQNRELLNQVE